MIGQNAVQKQINEQLSNGTFPRFSILVGPKGYGKKTLALEISKSLCYYPTLVSDLSMSNLRDIIQMAYTTYDTQVYILADCDYISPSAKNSLLKVLEEPPKNSYFIMTVENINNVLSTIKSRGTIYHLNEFYSCEDLEEFAKENNYSITGTILLLADCPGDIVRLAETDVNALTEYTELVFNNIEKVSDANAFKSAKRLALKKDSDGLPLDLFWKMFRLLCLQHIKDDYSKYIDGLLYTNKYLNKLSVRSINKASLFDMWLLEIRYRWRAYDISRITE